MNAHDLRPRPPDPLPPSLAWRLLGPLLAVSGLVILASITWTLASDVSHPRALVRFGPLLLAGIGFSLMAAGAARRVGDTVHCAACDYQMRPGTEAAAACPECGAKWSAPGGTVVGRLKRNRTIFWGGLVVAALYLSGPLSGLLLGRSLHLMAAPTARLIDRVVAAAPGGATATWDELGSRLLTPGQEIELARGLLDKRLERRCLSRDAQAWLETAIAGGRLPEALVDRYDGEQ
jgi:hypothetical protein